MKIIVLLSIILSMNFSILNAQEVNVELKCQPKGESKIILLMFVQVNGEDWLMIAKESAPAPYIISEVVRSEEGVLQMVAGQLVNSDQKVTFMTDGSNNSLIFHEEGETRSIEFNTLECEK